MMLRTIICLLLVSMNAVPAVPETAATWNPAWKSSQEIAIQETAGIDRKHEPVECEIQFAHLMSGPGMKDIVTDVKRDVRVVHLEAGDRMKEIPSQLYEVHAGNTDETKNPPTIPVRARVVFFADVAAFSTERYVVCYGNTSAKPPQYPSELHVTGQGVHYNVENTHYRILTEEVCGQIDQIDLKFATEPSLRFPAGTLHWNPDFIIISDNYPTDGYNWYYAHHFVKPEFVVESGPVFFSIMRWQIIPGQDVVYMEVYYRFYSGLPYFVSETYIEAKEDTRTFAIRNDELAFSRNDFNLVGWRNKTLDMKENHMGEIGSTGLFYEGYQSGHVLGSALPPNMAWISMLHRDNGYGIGSIRLGWENVNVLTGEPSPIYNSHTVISEHDGVLYWFRSLIYSPRVAAGVSTDQLMEFLVDVPKGSSYSEKNAYVVYETDKDRTFAPIDSLYFSLRKPLEVHVLR